MDWVFSVICIWWLDWSEGPRQLLLQIPDALMEWLKTWSHLGPPLSLSLSLCSQGLFMWTLQQGGWISYTEAQGSKSLRQKWPITLKAGPITGIAVIAITGQPGFKSQSTYSHLLMSLWLTWNVGAGSGAQISSSLQPNISFIRLANFSPPYLHFIDAETEA